MQKKFGIVVVAAIQGVAKAPVQAPRPGVHKSSHRRLHRRKATPVVVAA